MFKKRKKSDKKGMMEDFFDILFTVFVGVFLLIFLGLAMVNNVKAAEKQAVTDVAKFKVMDTAVNNLRLQLYEGVNLEKVDLDAKTKLSKLLKYTVITDCADYRNEPDCSSDLAEIIDNDYDLCKWVPEKDYCVRAPKKVLLQ